MQPDKALQLEEPEVAHAPAQLWPFVPWVLQRTRLPTTSHGNAIGMCGEGRNAGRRPQVPITERTHVLPNSEKRCMGERQRAMCGHCVCDAAWIGNLLVSEREHRGYGRNGTGSKTSWCCSGTSYPEAAKSQGWTERPFRARDKQLSNAGNPHACIGPASIHV